MADTRTDELIKQVARINEERELDRKRRHDLNNKLGVTLLSMDADLKRHEDGMLSVENLGRIVVALDHIVRGVDGKNGLRGNYQQMKETIESVVDQFNDLDRRLTEKLHNLDIKMAALAAGFAVAGQFVVTMVTRWLS